MTMFCGGTESADIAPESALRDFTKEAPCMTSSNYDKWIDRRHKDIEVHKIC